MDGSKIPAFYQTHIQHSFLCGPLWFNSFVCQRWFHENGMKLPSAIISRLPAKLSAPLPTCRWWNQPWQKREDDTKWNHYYLLLKWPPLCWFSLNTIWGLWHIPITGPYWKCFMYFMYVVHNYYFGILQLTLMNRLFKQRMWTKRLTYIRLYAACSQ